MRLLALALLASATIAAPAAAADFTQTGPYALPGAGPAGPASTYPITFNVTGLIGTITDVNFTLTGLSHNFPRDLDILLVGPTGANVILMSDVGGRGSISGVTYIFDQQATRGIDPMRAAPSGTYLPSNNDEDGVDLFSDGPIGPFGDSLNVFNGTDPNGLWQLYIVDDLVFDSGSLASATLSITTSSAAAVPEPATWAMMIGGFGLIGGAMRRRRATSAITYA